MGKAVDGCLATSPEQDGRSQHRTMIFGGRLRSNRATSELEPRYGRGAAMNPSSQDMATKGRVSTRTSEESYLRRFCRACPVAGSADRTRPQRIVRNRRPSVPGSPTPTPTPMNQSSAPMVQSYNSNPCQSCQLKDVKGPRSEQTRGRKGAVPQSGESSWV